MENPFQLVEMSITRVGQLILKHIQKEVQNKDNPMSVDTAIEMIAQYLYDCNPISNQSKKFTDWCSQYDEDDKRFLIENMCNDGFIDITVETMHDVLTIDDLNKLYKDFPFVKQTAVYVPLEDSNGNIRHIPARRKVVMGKEYMLRLTKNNQRIQ